MAVTTSSSKTALANASQTPTVTVPTDAAAGDVLYAVMTYGGTDAIATQPAGWTVLATGTLSTAGSFSIVRRTMASGVTQAQWTITTNATAVYAKSSVSMIAVKGGNGSETLGTVYNRATSGTTSPLAGVTVATGGVLLAFAGDRAGTTPQSAITAPTGMTEEAKAFQTTGGGGTSTLIASLFPTAGASGTKTVTYSVADDSAYGVLLTVAPASGASVPSVTINPRTASQATGVAKTLSATVTGATSQAWTLEQSPPLASTTITNSTSATTASYTPTIAGTYVFRLTATNATGSSSDTLTLTVSGSTSRPVSVVANPANFVPVGSATSIEEALSDSLDATTVEGAQTAGPAFTVLYAPLTQTTAVTWHIRADVSAAPNTTCVFNLLVGTTVVATRTQAVTTTATTYSYVLTTGEVAAISNWADLRLQVVEQ